MNGEVAELPLGQFLLVVVSERVVIAITGEGDHPTKLDHKDWELCQGQYVYVYV